MSFHSTVKEDLVGQRLHEDPASLVPEIRDVTRALMRATVNGSVPRTTMSLVYLRAGQIVGSTYQVMRHSTDLRNSGDSEERIASVATWWGAECFTEAENAALALTEAVFQPNPRGEERVPDHLFAEVSRHFDDKALVTLMAILGSASYWMSVALITKPAPVTAGTPSAS